MVKKSNKTVIEFNFGRYYTVIHACLVNSQNYAPKCRRQLTAQSPEAAMPADGNYYKVLATITIAY